MSQFKSKFVVHFIMDSLVLGMLFCLNPLYSGKSYHSKKLRIMNTIRAQDDALLMKTT